MERLSVSKQKRVRSKVVRVVSVGVMSRELCKSTFSIIFSFWLNNNNGGFCLIIYCGNFNIIIRSFFFFLLFFVLKILIWGFAGKPYLIKCSWRFLNSNSFYPPVAALHFPHFGRDMLSATFVLNVSYPMGVSRLHVTISWDDSFHFTLILFLIFFSNLLDIT